MKTILQGQQKDSIQRNPNLIINWDFRNPVNRNGKMEYAGGSAYTIDRWRMVSGALPFSTSIEDGYIKITHAGTIAFRGLLGQDVDINQNYTLSFILREIGLISVTGKPPFQISVPEADCQLILKPIATSEENVAYASIYKTDLNSSFEIVAAKLELGDTQTLARQNDNGEWEIIDPPDYDLQYALCSLYSSSTGKWVGSQHSNENLLDNWYFVDLINQRGQTEYTAGTTGLYAIDRFLLCRGSLDVISGGISLTWNGVDGIETFIQQRTEIPEIFGKTVTFSVLTADNHLVSRTIEVGTTSGSNYGAGGKRDEETGIMLTIGNVSNKIAYYTILTNSTEPVTIVATKVEFGTVQTLAHKEGDTWVLNDPPPNKALELAKCQRYQMPIGVALQFRATGFNSNQMTFFVPALVTMRAMPTLSDNGIVVRTVHNYTEQTDFTFRVDVIGTAGFRILATKQNHGLTDAQIFIKSFTMLDANL